MNNLTVATNNPTTEIEVPEGTQEAIRQEIEATLDAPRSLSVSVEAKDLQEALKYIKGSIANRTTLPVLNNALLSTVGGKLQLTGTNLEVGMTKRISATVTGEGAITLPFKLLLDSVGKKGAVSLTLDDKSRTVTLVSELNGKRVTTDIKGISAEEYPIIPELTTPPLAMLDLPQLQTAIKQVAFCASDDDSRPVLAGVYMELYPNGGFVMAAADGFRLAKYDTGNCTGEPHNLIVPAKSALELLKMSGEIVQATITPSGDRVVFQNEVDEEVVTRIVEGNYVDISRVIPTDWSTRATLDTAELVDSVKLVMPFAKDSGNIVRFSVDANTLQVSANAAEQGSRVVDMPLVSLDTNQDNPQIALNGKFVLDVLAAVGSEQITLDMKTYQSPATIRPVDNDNLLYVVMPMYLPNR